MKKFIVTFSLILFYVLLAFAQRPEGQGGGNRPQGQGGGNRGPSIGRLYGKIIDADTRQSVPYASVVVIRSFGKKDTIIGGALTTDKDRKSVV